MFDDFTPEQLEATRDAYAYVLANSKALQVEDGKNPPAGFATVARLLAACVQELYRREQDARHDAHNLPAQ